MSIGNQKTEGGKGRNYPFQHNVLKGLQKTLEQLQVLIANTVSINGLATEATLSAINTKVSPFNRTPNLLRVTDAGTINVPIRALSVINLGSSSGIFMGEPLEPNLPLNFDAGSLNNVFSAGSFTYDATGTEFLIIFNT